MPPPPARRSTVRMGDQFPHPVWLADIVVGTDLESDDGVDLSLRADTMITGVSSAARILRHTSIPDIRGSITSSSTMSGCTSADLECLFPISGQVNDEPLSSALDANPRAKAKPSSTTRTLNDSVIGWLVAEVR